MEFMSMLGPLPEKSAYRHVELAGFPDDDKPVSQDLGVLCACQDTQEA